MNSAFAQKSSKGTFICGRNVIIVCRLYGTIEKQQRTKITSYRVIS